MSRHGTKIEWTHLPGYKGESWNPLRGERGNWHCTKVSEGCKNCYSERLNIRFGGPAFKEGADDFRLDPRILEIPLRWRVPRAVFVCSMCDLFHEKVMDEWIDAVYRIMAAAQNHLFLILTKRSARALDWYRMKPDAEGWPLKNVWLGVTAENQRWADERIPELLEMPAAKHIVSIEPMLSPVELTPMLVNDFHAAEEHPVELSTLGWVICGGESGSSPRAFDLEGARSLREQCWGASVPFFMKQDSGPRAGLQGRIPDDLWAVKEFPSV